MTELRARLAELEAENAQLRTSDLRLAHVLEIARIGSWELDLTTNEAQWAPETRALLGVSSEAPPNPETVLAVTEPEDRHIILEGLAAARAGSARYDITYRVNRPDGTHVIHSRGDTLRDEEGRPTRIVGIVQDVTEQEALREQLLHSQKMETLGRLAAGLAHDLNNMLTVIVGSCEFVAEAVAGDAAAFEDVSTIRDAADRAGELTRGLLAFSRKQYLRPEPTDVNEVVRTVQKMLERLLGDTIEVETDTAPVGVVVVDPRQLTQVLINLAVNARDAMPEGGTLRLSTAPARLPENAEQDYVLISVEDTGVGMDSDTLSRVFEPFFTTKAVHEGTGLGLSTAFGVIAQSGGKIQASSTAGEGSTFEIYLPVAGAARPASRRPPPPLPVKRDGAVILVVDDDAAVRRMAVRALERAGYGVLQAASGEQALLQYDAASNIDLLVTDMMMPGLSGRGVADALLARNPALRVLFTTGYAGDPILDGEERGANEVLLPKPFTPEQLVTVVGQALSR